MVLLVPKSYTQQQKTGNIIRGIGLIYIDVANTSGNRSYKICIPVLTSDVETLPFALPGHEERCFCW